MSNIKSKSSKALSAKEFNARKDFKKYFTKIKRKLNLSDDLENIIWIHLEAINHNTNDKFDDGIRHFGYKI